VHSSAGAAGIHGTGVVWWVLLSLREIADATIHASARAAPWPSPSTLSRRTTRRPRTGSFHPLVNTLSPRHETSRGRPTFTDNSRTIFNLSRSSLLAQFLGATNVCIAGFVKTQQPIHVAGDADAHAFADRATPLRGCRQPKRAGSAQVQSILPEIDLQCLGQSPRSSAEEGQARRAARTGHQFDPFQRLDGTQQNSATHPGRLARHIQQER
jgi:hypothetical protein